MLIGLIGTDDMISAQISVIIISIDTIRSITVYKRIVINCTIRMKPLSLRSTHENGQALFTAKNVNRICTEPSEWFAL